MWPSLEIAGWIYEIANIGLIIGLAIGIISTILVIWMGNVKEGFLRRDIANTMPHAAIAEQRAAEANLELAKLKAPRDLTLEQQQRITEKLRPFAGLSFQMFTYPADSEPASLANKIVSAVKSAGWKYDPDEGFLVGVASGIFVVIDSKADDRQRNAAIALLSALNTEDIMTAPAPSVGTLKTGIDMEIKVAKKP